MIVKIILLAFFDALAVLAISISVSKHDWAITAFLVVAIALINITYLGGRRWIPAKYLVPGSLFLVAFVIYPVIYTVYNSLTNYGTGNNLSKSQAVEQIQRNSISATEGAVRYKLQILAKDSPTGELAFLLTDTDGNITLGTPEGTTPVAPADIVKQGTRSTIDGYVALNLGQANSRRAEISAYRVPGELGEITNDGFGAAFAKTQRLTYDAATNTMVDNIDNTVFHENAGYFVSDSGQQLLPGWRAFIGTKNYGRLQFTGTFLRVFVWTMVFAIGSVLLTFGLGLFLAIVFSNERMKGRRWYRLAMIIPYALPSFMTALVWRGMFNQSFGVINRFLGADIPWLNDGTWAKASILLVNLWLGFPYMFLVCTGALQGIPSDLKEAATVDGATGWKAFKRITFPLLLIAVAPLLVASFAFNFNNFNIVFLLTEGRPAVQGSDAGQTDILISYMYKIAFGTGRGADYGLASALGVVIFLIVAAISAFSFKFTKSFEEVR